MTQDAFKLKLLNLIKLDVDDYKDCSIKELNDLVFHYNSSLRLTYTGFLVLKKIFKVYSFEMEEPLKPKQLVNLSKLSYPYFFTINRLILFSEQDAFELKLYGSVKKFLDNIR